MHMFHSGASFCVSAKIFLDDLKSCYSVGLS